MITLITGGQRSGKSTFAETLLKDCNDVVYFATAEMRRDDTEFLERIQTHKARRNKAWRTVECYKDFHRYFGTESHYIVDCVTNAVSRFMFEFTAGKTEILKQDCNAIFLAIQKTFSELIDSVRQRHAHLILVSNEVGSATVPMNALARCFVDLQGMCNSFLAQKADTVYLCVAGIPLKIK